ncbi:hypothetical protein XarbCFBP8138_11095 [Xanthomonas arboricola]|nr:hypothetical protein XarbCFBP8138_11095 [Xanthomonas arboricola]
MRGCIHSSAAAAWPTPDSRLPTPDSRLPNPESRIPNPEPASRILRPTPTILSLQKRLVN